MAGRPIELILAKQWGGLLGTPMLLLDAQGTLLYYNEPTEVLLGRSFGVTGPMVRGEWSSAFHFEDEDGQDMDADDTPLGAALDRQQGDQAVCYVRGVDGARLKIRMTAFPITGAGDIWHGVFALVTPVT